MRAFLLRSIDYQDADRIVTLYTDELGKVSALAKGVRKSTKRFEGQIPAFAELEVDVRKGRGELVRVLECRVVQYNHAILADLGAMERLGEFMREVDKLVRPDAPQPRVFLLLREVVQSVSLSGLALLAWRLRLWSLEGVAPTLEHCVRCGVRPAGGQAAYFHPQDGGIVCRACGGGPLLLSRDAMQVLWNAVRMNVDPGTQELGLAPAEKAMRAFAEAQGLPWSVGHTAKTRA